MERIGIRELRQNASVFVRGIKEGRRYEVTDRGVLVGYLVPAVEGGELERLIESGVVIAPKQSGPMPEPLEPTDGPSLSECLADMRAEDR